MPAPRLVRLSAAYHDGRAFPGGRPSVHETLVAARRPAAHYADRLELVDDLSDGEERGHRAERQAAEIHVNPGQHDPYPPVGEPVCGRHDTVVQELHFVDRDHFGLGPHGAEDPLRGIHRLGFHRAAVVRAHRVEPGVAGIEMRLEDLNVLARDHGPPHPADQLLALPGEHHAGDDFDPARAGAVEHGGERVVPRGRWVKEMPLSCGFSGGYPILWRFYAGFLVLPRQTGGIPRVFTALDPHKETP